MALVVRRSQVKGSSDRDSRGGEDDAPLPPPLPLPLVLLLLLLPPLFLLPCLPFLPLLLLLAADDGAVASGAGDLPRLGRPCGSSGKEEEVDEDEAAPLLPLCPDPS